MFLVILTKHDPKSTKVSGISVWVNTDNEDIACQRALAHTSELGYDHFLIDTAEKTCEEDYFRACESKAAFDRALQEGIAIRIQE